MLKANPTLRRALARNPRAAQALKLCNTPCFPSNATVPQIRRINDLLARAERAGVAVDIDRLRRHLHASRGNLDGAIRGLGAELREGIRRRRAITGVFTEAASRGVQAVESELPVLTRAGSHILVGVERHHPVFKMFLRAFDKMGIKGLRSLRGRLRPQRLVDIPTNVHRSILHELWDDLVPGMARGRGASSAMARRLDRLAAIRARAQGISLAVARRRVATDVLHRLQEFYDIALKDSPQLVAIQRSIDHLRERIGL
jgi:hypothetical protein